MPHWIYKMFLLLSRLSEFPCLWSAGPTLHPDCIEVWSSQRCWQTDCIFSLWYIFTLWCRIVFTKRCYFDKKSSLLLYSSRSLTRKTENEYIKTEGSVISITCFASTYLRKWKWDRSMNNGIMSLSQHIQHTNQHLWLRHSAVCLLTIAICRL